MDVSHKYYFRNGYRGLCDRLTYSPERREVSKEAFHLKGIARKVFIFFIAIFVAHQIDLILGNQHTRSGMLRCFSTH
ncbi:hypothetical protein P7H06_25915 [Paenibacillus larvae]|nr:hypothetical protein [Paenibacillus larvae]MDT2262239.1 hypothetical protein [Paenibacillus larvae]